MTLVEKSQNANESHLVSCEECYKDVPVSVESEDYVAYFCGLGCYNLWKKKHKDENPAIGEGKVFVYHDPELD